MDNQTPPTIGDLARRKGRAAVKARELLRHYPAETRIDAIPWGGRGGDRTLALLKQIERVTEPH